MKPMDLNKVILNTIDLINLQLKKNNIDLVFVLDDNIPQIIGDRISLEQLILNLILNSRDAIIEKDFPKESDGGSIRITTFSQNSTVCMVIEDNGTGISEDIIHRIWSPFFTTKRNAEGTGIGLSICNRILKDHGATVSVNTSEEGTIFSIDFPALIDGKSH
jgi:signal transduction histidine kinase